MEYTAIQSLRRFACGGLLPLALLGLCLGCGAADDPPPSASAVAPSDAQTGDSTPRGDVALPDASVDGTQSDVQPGPAEEETRLPDSQTEDVPGERTPREPREQGAPARISGLGPMTPPREVDPQRVRAAGLRRVAGKHVTLYTDLPADEAVDALPGLFDQAVPQWCDYFGIDPADVADWHTHGFLMQNRARFERAGLVPPDLPEFPNGFAAGGDFWLFDQTSPYYRRHLFLHEGTHVFMNNVIGGAGPPWYVEGIAELLATHQIENGQVRLNVFPQDRRTVPGLGRIEMVQKAVAEDRGLNLAQVLAFNNRAHLQNEPYGWCWALAALLDGHPRYRARYRALPLNLREPGFTRKFMKSVEDDWRELNEDWQVFVTSLAYGHDIQRTQIDYTPGANGIGETARVAVDASRGWQNTGLRLEAGRTYRLTADGRYTVATQPSPWWCEPGGVTLRYHAGRPLGRLLAVVRPDDGGGGLSPLLSPEDIGLSATLSPAVTGTLFLAINDSAGELAENTGTLEVHVTAEPEPVPH